MDKILFDFVWLLANFYTSLSFMNHKMEYCGGSLQFALCLKHKMLMIFVSVFRIWTEEKDVESLT